MPVLCRHSMGDEGGWAIWRMEESADQLFAMLPHRLYDEAYAQLKHQGRRTEWLAVRVLLAELLGRNEVITYLSSGKPVLSSKNYHISISHTAGYVAVAYHRQNVVGIDIERWGDRVGRVASRFTRDDEAAYIPESDALIYYLINWSAKETLFKLVGTAEVSDFKKAFQLQPYKLDSDRGDIPSIIYGPPSLYPVVHYQRFSDFICTWALL